MCLFSDGSLFLFDRKVLRYFRKDGHNWRKKKDGKTVKEAHERLKVSVNRYLLLLNSIFGNLHFTMLIEPKKNSKTLDSFTYLF